MTLSEYEIQESYSIEEYSIENIMSYIIYTFLIKYFPLNQN